ncbi:DinB family protein [Gramella lutea]|uniref:DinB family protein n=1 Tax=Christiangramia lutea TaxID=1607951 RepID=A0A9X2A9W6_9FLAO|nr:DinB family protein [Christiangramia lutea]MCH4822551.1 DinB family protein [Christiangramia lutea]
MKKIAFLLILLFSSFNTFSQDSDYINAFLKKWDNSRDYLLEIAKAMPEEKYSYKPTERQMSFSQQLAHINRNMTWIHSDYFLEKKISEKRSFPESKEEIIARLTESFDKISESVSSLDEKDLKVKADFFSGEMSKMQLLNLMQDHVSHHRGQLIVYLNLNSIEPPAYRGW